MKEETNNKTSEKRTNTNKEEFLFTDLLSVLFLELAGVCKSISRIAKIGNDIMNQMSDPHKLINNEINKEK